MTCDSASRALVFNHMRQTIAALVAAVAALNCSDSTSPGSCDANTGSVEASVQISGSAVVFDWSPACAVALVLIEEEFSDMWGIIAPGLSGSSTESDNIIHPPVTYGQVPSGAEELDAPQTLIAGHTYEVVLWKIIPAGANPSCQERNQN